MNKDKHEVESVKKYANAADMCRARNWTAGDVLVEALSRAYEIRFVGEQKVVARRVGSLHGNGKWEAMIGFEYFETFEEVEQWEMATPEQLAALRTTRWIGSEDISLGVFVAHEDWENDVNLRIYGANEHLVDVRTGEAWSSTVVNFRPLTILEVCTRLLGPGYSIVEHEGKEEAAASGSSLSNQE